MVPDAALPETTMPLWLPLASIVAPDPTSLSLTETVTDSPYVPAATEMVSPALDTSTACWIVRHGDETQLPLSLPVGETWRVGGGDAAAPAATTPASAATALTKPILLMVPPRRSSSVEVTPSDGATTRLDRSRECSAPVF